MRAGTPGLAGSPDPWSSRTGRDSQGGCAAGVGEAEVLGVCLGPWWGRLAVGPQASLPWGLSFGQHGQGHDSQCCSRHLSCSQSDQKFASSSVLLIRRRLSSLVKEAALHFKRKKTNVRRVRFCFGLHALLLVSPVSTFLFPQFPERHTELFLPLFLTNVSPSGHPFAASCKLCMFNSKNFMICLNSEGYLEVCYFISRTIKLVLYFRDANLLKEAGVRVTRSPGGLECSSFHCPGPARCLLRGAPRLVSDTRALKILLPAPQPEAVQ